MTNTSIGNHWYPPQFNLMTQYAEIHPTEKNTFRTFFVRHNSGLGRSEIVNPSNWMIGEVPPTIRIAHPHFIRKVRSGNLR